MTQSGYGHHARTVFRALKTRTDLKHPNVNVWISVYILDDRERIIFINDIEDQNNLKKNNNNNIDHNMSRSVKKNSKTKQKKKPNKKKKQLDKLEKLEQLEKKVLSKVSKFEKQMKEFWNNSTKQKIIDYEYKEILCFALEKINNQAKLIS